MSTSSQHMVIRNYDNQGKLGEYRTSNLAMFADSLSLWGAKAFASHRNYQGRALFVHLYTAPTIEELKLIKTIEQW